jgi:polysaccharide export outer membrane protein
MPSTRPAQALVALLAACASYGRPLTQVAPEINATLYTGPTLIEPGDVLELRFARKAEWNTTVRVRPDGSVSFPVLRDLRVAGNTIPELERTLGDQYQPILSEPDLTLNFSDPLGQEAEDRAGVVVSGEVTKPGLIGTRGGRLTLLEALGRAGGQLKSTALLGNTLMIRRSPQTGLCTAWNIDARMVHWATAEPVWLQPHDLIFVPNTPIDDLDIWMDQYVNRLLPLGLTSFALGVAVARR